MEQPLHRKKLNYIASAQKLASRLEPKINQTHVLWILGRFIHYAAMMLCHGHIVTISKKVKFTPMYVLSSDFEDIEKEARYARSSAIHGVFLTVISEGKFPDKYKARFKPSIGFRKKMEEHLSYPDLTYKLIT